MKKTLLSLMLVVASAAVPASSFAQANASKITEGDATFLSDWIALNTYEMMLTRMASQKALSADLRQTADMMSAHHQRTEAELTSYANRFNVSIAPDKREKYVAKVEKWDGDASGPEWDRDIVEELVAVHREAVRMMKAADTKLKDQQLKKMASANLPVLQQHLDQLVPLKDRIRSNNSTAAATPPVQETGAAKDIPAGNEKDAKFLSDLRLMNAYELQLIEQILKKGTHRALKDAAHEMLDDHRRLEERLSAYASKKMYGNDPDEASKTTEKTSKWMQKKGGMEWDADIIEELIDTHKDGIDMLEDAVSDVRDEELSAIMNEAIPPMRKHLTMLEPLKETVKKPWKQN